jgi:hypothetical protein
MDNVLNRPLFRHREARDRLNESVGVQRFQEGGPVFERTGRQPVRPAGLPSAVPAGNLSYLDLVEKARQGGRVTYEDYSSLLESESVTNQQAQDVLAMVEQPGYVPSEVEVDIATRPNFSRMPETVPNPEDTRGLRALTGYLGGVFGGETLGEVEKRRQDEIRLEQEYRDSLAAGGFEGALQEMREGEEDLFENLDRAAESAAPQMSGMEMEARGSRPPKLGPSGMEMEARGQGPRAAATQPTAPTDRSTMEADARDRGPLITNPADVAAGLNAEDPAVREKTVTDFMKEYSDAAPKYEGMDKGLLLAQIGFAIAAGESPNAMQNIANGLLAGSDMMLKDKAAKDEFNRQVQLSAMQYGFGEAASQRALERQFTDYVASGPVDYRGKTYLPGESVPVLHSDIINGRMPSGVVSESLSDAMMTTDAALRKAAAEAVENQTLKPEQYRETITVLDQAASSFSAARNLIPLIESSILRNADGEVTGIRSAATKAINQAANLVGVDLGSQFESREAYDSAMRNVAVKMVQDLLGESGRTISDADRQLIDRLVGLQADVISGAAVDPDVLNRKLQEILREAESKQQSALDTYTTLMEGLGGTYTPSGTPFRSLKAERVFNPPTQARPFRYDVTEDGKYVKVYTDGGQ